MNRDLKELIELSKIDRAIDEFIPVVESTKKKLKRKTQAKEKIEKSVIQLEEKIESIKEKIVSFDEQIKSLSEQLSQNVAKERLIKTEKEQKALQTETELAKEKLKFANEEIERHNKILDSKISQLNELREELKKAEEVLFKVETEVSIKLEDIEKQKAKLFAQREEKTLQIDQRILSFYEKIKVWARNSVVVPVKKQACYGCYMKLNDSAYAEVIKSEDIVTCHYCGRILYIEPQTLEVE